MQAQAQARADACDELVSLTQGVGARLDDRNVRARVMTLSGGRREGVVALPEDAARALGMALHRGPMCMRHWCVPPGGSIG